MGRAVAVPDRHISIERISQSYVRIVHGLHPHLGDGNVTEGGQRQGPDKEEIHQDASHLIEVGQPGVCADISNTHGLSLSQLDRENGLL